MRWVPSLLLCFFLLLLPASPQLGAPLGRCGPHPPDDQWPRNELPPKPVSTVDSKKPASDPAQLARDAHELAELTASIPGDINRLNSGLLSKDLMEKLKRVEKLSKRLRNELAQ
jgi:hypothetical protein